MFNCMEELKLDRERPNKQLFSAASLYFLLDYGSGEHVNIQTDDLLFVI